MPRRWLEGSHLREIDRRHVISAAGVALAAATGGAWCCAQAKESSSLRVDVSVEDYGADVNREPQRNLAAFRAALAATPTGGRLLIPDSGEKAFYVDTSGGLDHALAVERSITIVLDGRMRATHGRSASNPPYLFHVKAPDVAFVGTGHLSGPGYVDDTNLQDDRMHAGLIYVTGDDFRFQGPTVSNVPKIGIHLWKCRGATVSARWRGGIRDYVTGHTGLFAIRATGGGGHRIVSNRFERDEAGRRLITGYFAGGLMGATTGDLIADNVADVHEKLAYLFTNGSTVRDCSISDALQTDILRVVGSDNLVERIEARRIKGGISIYNGARNIVRQCRLLGVRQSGVFVSFTGSDSQGAAGTIVSENIIEGSAAATTLQDGICLYLGAGDLSGIEVTNNRIAAQDGATWRNGIRIEVIPPFFGRRITIRGNALDRAVNGVSVRRVIDAEILNNRASRLGGGEALLRITS